MNSKKFSLKAKIALLTSMMILTSVQCSTIMAQNKLESLNIGDTGNDDWLHAKGGRLYDKDGNEVWMTGANWFGFNCSENVFHGLWGTELDSTLKSVADRGINLLRVPISTELLYSWMQGKPADDINVNWYMNPGLVKPDGTNMNSMEVFDETMRICKKYGIKVMVDVHSPDANNSGHFYELWYGKAMKDGTMVTTDMWIDTWVWLVDKYKNDDTLIAVDLKNEPHGTRGYTKEEPNNFAKWDNTQDENNWKYAAEKCGKAILEVNPNMLIVVEGIEQTPRAGYTYADPDVWESSDVYAGGWWGGNLRRAKEYPVDLGEHQSQLVYSPHDYGPLVYAQSWFNKDFTEQTLLDDYWYDSWAYLEQENIAPLLMGEWGGTLDGGDNEKWLNILANYMTNHRINHTFWCLNPNSGDTGGLLYYDFSTWDEVKYAIMEPTLWQNDEGTYIGLDHQIPLGKNGMTVSEYYGDKPVQKVPVSSISLDQKEVILKSGEEVKLLATVLPTNASNKNITFTSSNTSIAVVDTNGKITAKNTGEVIITAISEDGNKKATTKVLVEKEEVEEPDKPEEIVKVTSVSLDKKSIKLFVDESNVLNATILPANATNKDIIYSSSDNNIVKVDSKGNITAISEGKAIITVSTVEGNKKAYTEVEVAKVIIPEEPEIPDTDVPVTQLTPDNYYLQMSEGSSYKVNVEVKPSNATNKEVKWYSKDSSIASVSMNGTITALKAGDTIITAESVDGGHKVDIQINVCLDKLKVNSMWMNTYWLQMNKGDTHQMIAYFSPVNATNRSTAFVSSDESVITVDQTGVVTAVGKGMATITTTSLDSGIEVVTTFVVQ